MICHSSFLSRALRIQLFAILYSTTGTGLDLDKGNELEK